MNDSINPTNNTRVLWVDIIKGILIILVVIGHATGRFNTYIYQFHIGVFFLISGYVAYPERRTLVGFSLNRFLTLWLPRLVIFLGMLFFCWLLKTLGVYTLFFSEKQPFIGIIPSIKSFVITGSMNIYWLGATWFIGALFWCSILNRLILRICGDRYSIIYAFLIMILYFAGYGLVTQGKSLRGLDLVLIAQFFYGMGTILGHYFPPKVLQKTNPFISMGLLLIALYVLYIVKTRLHIAVDYPSRAFNSPFMDLIGVVAGLIFSFSLSQLIARVPVINRGFSYIGKNSVAIMYFHFMFFNAGYFVLYLFGITPLSYLQNFVPTTEIGNKYWCLISFFAIILSLALWSVVSILPYAGILLGRDKPRINNAYVSLRGKKTFVAFEGFIERLDCSRIKWGLHTRDTFLKLVSHNRYYFIACLFLVVGVVVPLVREGIIVNDELQIRLLAKGGFLSFFSSAYKQVVHHGRALAVVGVVGQYLAFLGQSTWVFKIAQIFFLLVSILLFCELVVELFEDKTLALLCVIVLLAMLPVSFEHTLPNAFSWGYLSSILVYASMILFVRWQKTNKKKTILFSMILLLVAETMQEVVVTYTIAYFIIHFQRNGRSKAIAEWKRTLWPIGTSVVYLFLYFVARVFWPSHYEGNSLVFPSLSNSIRIVANMFCSSIPGYYLFLPKYHYLFKIYQDISIDDVFRVIIVACSFGIAFFYTLHKDSDEKKDNLTHIVLATIGCVLIGALAFTPYCISQMYQNYSIKGNGFLALPVSFKSYFPLVLLLCYLIVQLFRRIPKAGLSIIMTLACMILVIQIQLMNGEFSERHQQNFERLEYMEALVSSDIFKECSGMGMVSSEMFETRDALGFHDTYWKDYARAVGSPIRISKGEPNEGTNRIFFDDDCFYIWLGDQLCVMTKRATHDYFVVPYDSNRTLLTACSTPTRVSDWNCYFFKYADETLIESTFDAFKNRMDQPGNTFDTIHKTSGFYTDGWVAPEFSFSIQSGKEGIIVLKSCLPTPPTDEACVSCVVDNGESIQYKLMDYTRDQLLELAIPCKTESVISVQVLTNYVQPQNNKDKRKLSFLIQSIEGK